MRSSPPRRWPGGLTCRDDQVTSGDWVIQEWPQSGYQWTPLLSAWASLSCFSSAPSFQEQTKYGCKIDIQIWSFKVRFYPLFTHTHTRIRITETLILVIPPNKYFETRSVKNSTYFHPKEIGTAIVILPGELYFLPEVIAVLGPDFVKNFAPGMFHILDRAHFDTIIPLIKPIRITLYSQAFKCTKI